jgi:hypothetical protein
MPSKAAIARLSAVGVNAVGGLLDRLRDANPDLFPILVDRRRVQLDLFFSGVPEWASRVAVLGEVFADENEFWVARELAASVLEGKTPPSDREIARLCGIARRETVRMARSQVTKTWRRSRRDLSFIGDLSEPRRPGRPRHGSGTS